jgi:pimeloyl-ACP methyl ester carboxylesterase
MSRDGPDATLRIIPGAGHLFFLEPEDTLEILTEFLGHA